MTLFKNQKAYKILG